VVAEIPADAIEAPSQKTLLWYEVFDNRRWRFGGAGSVFVLGYYLVVWSAVGRDPKGGAIIPLFQPPAGISPGELHPRLGFHGSARGIPALSRDGRI